MQFYETAEDSHLFNVLPIMNLRNTSSLVKLHYFRPGFLENCVHKKQKKSIKDQRIFCSNTFFKVIANSVNAHFKLRCSDFFCEQNSIIFFTLPIANLPEIEECFYLTTTMECNLFQI